MKIGHRGPASVNGGVGTMARSLKQVGVEHMGRGQRGQSRDGQQGGASVKPRMG